MIVVDASVALKCVFDEIASDLARELLIREPSTAPAFIDVEAANAARTRTARRELDGQEALGLLAGFQRLPIQRRPDLPLLPVALRLGVALSHPVYDCLYLALALELGVGVATADRRFATILRRGDYADRVKFIGPDQP